MNAYNDDDVYFTIARTIVRTLVYGVNSPLSYEDHPFHLYAQAGQHIENIRRLAEAVRAQANSQEERQIVTSFFHPGGTQRPALEDLMDDFYDFVDESTLETDDSQDTLVYSHEGELSDTDTDSQ